MEGEKQDKVVGTGRAGCEVTTKKKGSFDLRCESYAVIANDGFHRNTIQKVVTNGGEKRNKTLNTRDLYISHYHGCVLFCREATSAKCTYSSSRLPSHQHSAVVNPTDHSSNSKHNHSRIVHHRRSPKRHAVGVVLVMARPHGWSVWTGARTGSWSGGEKEERGKWRALFIRERERMDTF